MGTTTLLAAAGADVDADVDADAGAAVVHPFRGGGAGSSD